MAGQWNKERGKTTRESSPAFLEKVDIVSQEDKIGEKWEGFANFWRTTQLEYTWLRSLMKRHKDFWKITEDSLDKSMKVFGIDISMKNDLLNLYKVLSPYPEVEEVLKSLKKKNLKLAILSNGTPALLNEWVQSNI